jgi:hypothetical protein
MVQAGTDKQVERVAEAQYCVESDKTEVHQIETFAYPVNNHIDVEVASLSQSNNILPFGLHHADMVRMLQMFSRDAKLVLYSEMKG